MKKLLTFFLVAAAGLLFAAEEKPRGVAVRFNSTPEGAQVFVDGVLKGKTPFSIPEMTPEVATHIRMEMEDHEPFDAIYTPKKGESEPVFGKLQPMKGLLLLNSEPAGAQIVIDGYSKGETPLLITTLDVKKEHAIVLKKTGYLDNKIEVRFNGRRPLVRNVKLVLNSGVANITSDPQGAEVVLNGILRGTTPVVVSEIPNGRMTIVLKKDGYETLSREIAINAGDAPSLYYKLNPLPGKLNLTSVPTGARFYINGEPRGDGPIYLKDLTPGTYTVKAEKDGFDSLTREIVVEKGATVNEEFRLSSNLAKLEIRTRPAGIEVEVDGRVIGRTEGTGDSTAWSDSLIISDLKAGEHTVRLTSRGYSEEIRHPVLNVSSTTSLKISMKKVFTPDTRVITSTERIEGVRKTVTGTYITLEVKPGVERTIQDYRRIEYLDLQ